MISYVMLSENMKSYSPIYICCASVFRRQQPLACVGSQFLAVPRSTWLPRVTRQGSLRARSSAIITREFADSGVFIGCRAFFTRGAFFKCEENARFLRRRPHQLMTMIPRTNYFFSYCCCSLYDAESMQDTYQRAPD